MSLVIETIQTVASDDKEDDNYSRNKPNNLLGRCSNSLSPFSTSESNPRHLISSLTPTPMTPPSFAILAPPSPIIVGKTCRRIDRLSSSHDRLCNNVPWFNPPRGIIKAALVGRILSLTLGGRRRDIQRQTPKIMILGVFFRSK